MSQDYTRAQLLSLQIVPVLRDLVTLATNTRDYAAAGHLREIAINLRGAAEEIESALDRPTPPAAPNVIPFAIHSSPFTPQNWGGPDDESAGDWYREQVVS